MKHLSNLVLILSLFIFVSCDKSESLNTQVEGTWELRFVKGQPNASIYKFSGSNFERTVSSKPAGSGTFEISKINDRDREAGVVYPYKITFIIDGSKLGTYLNIGDNTIVMTSGQAGVDETQFIYDRVK